MQSVVRLVIDTVGFVRAVLYPDSLWGTIVFDWSSNFSMLLSDELESEMLDVFGRPFLREKLGIHYEIRMSAAAAVLDLAERVQLVDIPAVSRDPNDDKILATAVAGAADFIATEDKDLLDIGEYEGIRIVTGFELLSILRVSD